QYETTGDTMVAGEQIGRWSVMVTDNGGSQWTTTLRLTPYVWGIDSFGTQHVWVEGADGLYSSDDGGLLWRRAGEPKGTALVRVAFESTSEGVGLTVNGDIATTSDGGETWIDQGQSSIPILGSNYIGGAANLCISGPAVVLDDSRGDILRSTDPANPKSWARVFSSRVPASYQGLSTLDCATTGAVWEETYTEIQGPQGGIALGWVVRSGDHGVSWVTTGSIFGKGLDLPALSQSKWGSAFSSGIIMSSGASEPVEAMVSSESNATAAIVQSADGAHFVSDNLEGFLGGRVPISQGGAGPPDSSIAVGRPFYPSFFGITYDSPTDGWFDAVVDTGTDSSMRQTNIVFHTTNSGSDWKPIYVSSP
ncbi:MAG: WD40/YVTN/BNR-like repeat-containing protein, partial [Acidimicrobiales bacterium]